MLGKRDKERASEAETRGTGASTHEVDSGEVARKVVHGNVEVDSDLNVAPRRGSPREKKWGQSPAPPHRMRGPPPPTAGSARGTTTKQQSNKATEPNNRHKESHLPPQVFVHEHGGAELGLHVGAGFNHGQDALHTPGPQQQTWEGGSRIPQPGRYPPPPSRIWRGTKNNAMCAPLELRKTRPR